MSAASRRGQETDPATARAPADVPGAPAWAPRRRFHAPCGIVEGWVDGDLVRATGIRYARAERFREPVPAPDADGIIEATSWSPASPQHPDAALEAMYGADVRPLRSDEDCHFLSVTMPGDLAANERVPVMVWIHGGSYRTGAGDSGATDPADLVVEQRVIVVTVTYRLGLLGYLGGAGRGANLGLLDQAQALRWVRRNIAAFGGDDRRVTGFGESAGGDAIAHLLAAFPEEDLMDRAIVQSAPLGIMRGRRRMTETMIELAESIDPAAPLEELAPLEATITETIASAPARYGMRVGMPWGVQYGRRPLPAEEEMRDAWLAAAGIPLLVGTTATEATLFTEPVAPARALRRLPLLGLPLHDAVVAAITRAVFDDGADTLARLWAAGGGPVRRYTVTWSAAGNPMSSPHGLDVALLFAREGNWRQVAAFTGTTWEDIRAAGTAMRAVWGAFARGDDASVATVGGVIQVREVRGR